MSCEIPTTVHPHSTLDPVFLKSIIQSCQISSRICKVLSAKGLDDQPTKLLEIINKYNQELLSWQNSLPAEMRPKLCYKNIDNISLSRTLGIILIHCSFNDLLMVLNAPLAYPWINSALRTHSNSDLVRKIDAQITESSETVIESARKIIIMTRHFDLNGANTHAYET